MLFAGRELATKINYLKNQGKELGLSVNVPKRVEFLVVLYIKIFGIPEIGFQERFDFFQNCTKNLNGNFFIDAGCGNGAYSRYMAKIFPTSQIVSFDIEEKLVKLAKNLTQEKRISVSVGDLTKTNQKLKNRGDIVWSLDVLEHISNYKKAINNLSFMVKKGGYLIIHVPLVNQKRWFNYFKSWTHDTHEREGYQKKEIIGLLKKFKIIKEVDTFGGFGSLIWEINTLLFKRVPLLAVILFPFLRLLMIFDKYIPSKKHNCFGVLARKI
ncbi:MAG: class I SAM-dependent methyltransferase [Patescibacteria group bacterium]